MTSHIREVVILLTTVVFVTHETVNCEVSLWPQPRWMEWDFGPSLCVASDFKIILPNGSPQVLREAASRFTKTILQEKWIPVQVSRYPTLNRRKIHMDVGSESQRDERNSTVLKSVKVMVHDLNSDLQQDVNETYTLGVNNDGRRESVIEAGTVWGALHGLETLSQLLVWNSEASCVGLEQSGVQIWDSPLYGYRGILLDVARNFYPLKDLVRTIRAMAYNKLNVLHLHLTDSQSFPVEIPSEPDLANKGSYGARFVYSANDIRALIAYARRYGVRLLPEIDMPGHSGSWGAAYPDVVTCKDGYDWSDVALEPAPGQLNPLNTETYPVVRNVIDYVASTFPDKFFHAGNDEIVGACWMTDPKISSYVKSGNGTLSDLLQKFVETTKPFITSHNKTVVYWEDVLLNSKIHVDSKTLPSETTIFETWNNGPLNTKRLTSSGYRTIVASSDFYYLDCGRGSFLGNDTAVDVEINPSPGVPSYNYGGDGGSWCAPYKSWQRIYDYDISYNLTESEAKLVIGGEVLLWSEQADGAVLDGLLWPRASALAEALWSGNREKDGQLRSVDALYRLNDWRYRLVSRGINAMPLQPMWCLKHPGDCNS